MPTAIEEMDTGVVSLQTHKEFERRMDDANAAFDRRVTDVEHSMETLRDMSNNVSELAITMRAMVEEQHEQHQDIREIRSTVQSINVEHLELKVVEHDQRLDDHDKRIRAQELKPQDSDDHEQRIRSLESKPGKNWEKVVGLVIGGIVTFLVGLACSKLWG